MATTELAAKMQPGVFSMRRTAQPWLDLLSLALLTEIPNSSHPLKTQWVFFLPWVSLLIGDPQRDRISRHSRGPICVELSADCQSSG